MQSGNQKKDYNQYRTKGISKYESAYYNTALIYFNLAKGSGYKAPNDDIDEWIRKTNEKLSASNNVSGGNNTVFFDDSFDNNNNNWAVGDAVEHEQSISGGYLYFEHKRTERGWIVWKSMDIAESGDFVIETSFQQLNADDNSYFGFMWGAKDNDNYHEFLISANGKYYIDYEESGTEKKDIGWETSSYINTGYAYNKMAIKKIGSTVYFYVNDKFLYQVPYRSFYGKNFGLVIYKKAKLKYSYIKAYKPSATEANEIKGTISSYTTVFYDTFTSNSNDWTIKTDENVTKTLTNGNYIIDYKVEEGGNLTWQKIKVQDDKDYEFTTQFNIAWANENAYYGMWWGSKDTENNYQFLISKNGKYLIYKEEATNGNRLVDWTESSYINTYGLNTISVKREASSIKFYINDKYVNSIPSSNRFMDDWFALVVYHKAKIEFNYVSVKGYEKE